MEKDNYTLIEKYLNGELNEEEIKKFQSRLKEDTVFAEEYTLQKSMNIFLEKNRNQPALESKLASIGKDFFVEGKNEQEDKVIPISRNKNRNRWIIGLIATAAVAALLVMFNPFQEGDLYQQYAAHQPISLTEKSTGNDVSTKAETAFNQKNYALAYENLTLYLQENPADQKAQLALGISALEDGKTTEAITIFEKMATGDSAFKDYGTWYLALSYLKQKDFEKAKSFLSQVPNSEKSLFKKAQKLLKDLD
ncbi:MAG: tol-pal system YbgF family protein [Saprospiraceae bacterium]